MRLQIGWRAGAIHALPPAAVFREYRLRLARVLPDLLAGSLIGHQVGEGPGSQRQYRQPRKGEARQPDDEQGDDDCHHAGSDRDPGRGRTALLQGGEIVSGEAGD